MAVEMNNAMGTTIITQVEGVNTGSYVYKYGSPTRETHRIDHKTKSQSTQLKGINRSGAEFACVMNTGIFDGPVDADSVEAIKSWNVGIVRLPLNEDCWLDINGHNPDYTGTHYIKAITDFVKLLRGNGLKVILDLHWSDGLYQGPGQGNCYTESAMCQKPMPDKQNAPNFWGSVAEHFKNDEGIIFDLFNEPFPEMVINDKNQAWKCWRDGGHDNCPGFQYEVAGMQDLVDAVRYTGAKNQLMVGGLEWANDLSEWLQYTPTDPENNIAASWHSYNFNRCNNKECWESVIAPIAGRYPLITGEIGENGCDHTYIDGLMTWLDSTNITYLAWTWNTWSCSSGPSLISNYDGTATNYGIGFKNHLASKKTQYQIIR